MDKGILRPRTQVVGFKNFLHQTPLLRTTVPCFPSLLELLVPECPHLPVRGEGYLLHGVPKDQGTC